MHHPSPGGREKMSSGSRFKKASLRRDDVPEGRSTLASSGSHVFGHVRASFTNVPDRRWLRSFSVELAVSPHSVTARPWDDYR